MKMIVMSQGVETRTTLGFEFYFYLFIFRVFFFFFPLLCHVPCRISIPLPGDEAELWQGKPRILTTWPLGNSPTGFYSSPVESDYLDTKRGSTAHCSVTLSQILTLSGPLFPPL